MASVYGAIANGGVWIQPHLVDRVEGKGPVRPERRRLISPQTTSQLRSMLRGVVEEGSGVEAQVPGYVVAGKTGTAAKPDPVNGGYSDSRYVASFVGFAPARNPRLVVLVTVDEPRGTIWGGTAAAPAFREIAQFALQYFQVPPNAPDEATTASIEEAAAESAEAAAETETETDPTEAPATTTDSEETATTTVTDATAGDG